MKLFRVKQIIAEVVKNSHISSEIKKLVTEDNNLQQSIEQYVNSREVSHEEVEEALNEFPVEDIVNPYEQTLDEMIAEEMEEAKKVFVTEFSKEEEPEPDQSAPTGGKVLPDVQKVLNYIENIDNVHEYAQLFQAVLQHPLNSDNEKGVALKKAAGAKVAAASMDALGE